MSEPIQDRPCRHCFAPGPHSIAVRESGVHYADVRCCQCNLHLGFLSKPEAEKPKRSPQHRDMVLKFSPGYCELCRTPQESLPKGETLEAHHVIPFHEDGPSTRANCWILCTACHKLVEWRRTYQKHVLEAAEKMTAWRDDAPF